MTATTSGTPTTPPQSATPGGGPLSRLLAGDWIDMCARRWGPRPCLVDGAGQHRTFAEVAHRVDRLAKAMTDRGVRHGDRVAVLATDSPEHVEVVLACLRAGFVLCDLNFRLQDAELATILRSAEPAALLYSTRYAAMVPSINVTGVPEERLWSIDGPDAERATVADLVDSTPHGLGPGHYARDEQIVSIAFTSGTTGIPKGVMQSERMLRALVYQGISEIRVLPGGLRYSGAPLFHVSGILSILYSMVGGCASLILPQFDPPTVLHWMRDGGLTHCTLIPTMITALLDLPDSAADGYPKLRSILYGGAPMTPALLRRTITTFDCDLYQGFGAGTETGLQTMLYPEEHRRAMDGAEHLLASVGRPVPGVDVRLCDDELRDVPPGEPGEVVSRSETVMSGYLGQPELTARSVVDGWFRAGDMAQMDDEGYLYLTTRKADTIVRGGENVYPVEIEATLAEHAAVAEVTVVGQPDEYWGEIVAAAVVIRPGAALDVEELRAFCRERLAGYKVPTEVVTFAELPKNSTGKIVKSAVAAMVAARSSGRNSR